jgi:hypothetical protein
MKRGTAKHATLADRQKVGNGVPLGGGAKTEINHGTHRPARRNGWRTIVSRTASFSPRQPGGFGLRIAYLFEYIDKRFCESTEAN